MAYVERGPLFFRGLCDDVGSIDPTHTRVATPVAIVNFIGVFFAIVFLMEKADAYRKGSGSSKKWDGGSGGGRGGSGRDPYGGGGPPRGLDNNVRGIDHSSLPACGSCCN